MSLRAIFISTQLSSCLWKLFLKIFQSTLLHRKCAFWSHDDQTWTFCTANNFQWETICEFLKKFNIRKKFFFLIQTNDSQTMKCFSDVTHDFGVTHLNSRLCHAVKILTRVSFRDKLKVFFKFRRAGAAVTLSRRVPERQLQSLVWIKIANLKPENAFEQFANWNSHQRGCFHKKRHNTVCWFMRSKKKHIKRQSISW